MLPRPLLVVFAIAVFVCRPTNAQVVVADPWVRATVPGQMATGAFMTLTAPTPARLVGAASPVAGIVEIHEMALDGNVMRMREVDAVDLPAGRAVTLKPGGYHVMLMDLRRRIVAGETVPVTLLIETGGTRAKVEVKAVARAVDAAGNSAAETGR